jgi:hypothetical protein
MTPKKRMNLLRTQKAEEAKSAAAISEKKDDKP